MPRYISLDTLKGPIKNLLRPLKEPLPVNPIQLQMSPHQYLATLPVTSIPPNVRIEAEVHGDRRKWQGLNRVEMHGGRDPKEHGKEWREGAPRGGLKWALKER